MPLYQARLAQAWSRVPKGLQEHMERVRAIARDLARPMGLDLDKVEMAARCHDLARGMKAEALLREARRCHISVGPVEKAVPVLLHGPVAAAWLRQEMGVDDPEVIEAVRWHSTGRKAMGPIAKVVFLADKLDEEKVKLNSGMEAVKALAYRDIDKALLAYMDMQLKELIEKGLPIHPASVEARNELVGKRAIVPLQVKVKPAKL